MIHIENTYASRQRKRPRGPRSTPAQESVGSQQPSPQGPLIHLETQALMYYLRHHLRRPKDALSILKGQTSDFLPVWKASSEGSVLDLAVRVMSLAVFAHTHQHPKAAIEASGVYDQLLRLARISVVSLGPQNLDACLLAIFFMSRYEDVVYVPASSSGGSRFISSLHSTSHHDGALSILEAWKEHLGSIQPASDVIKHTRRGMIRSALMRGRAPPLWMTDGVCFGETGLDLEYDSIVIRIATLRHHVSTLVYEQNPTMPPAQSLTLKFDMLNQEAQDVHWALRIWTTHFPTVWDRHTHNFPFHTSEEFYSSTAYSYSSPEYAAVWSLYFAMTMLVNGTRLRLLKLSSTASVEVVNQQCLDCLSNIDVMADEFMATLPFLLQISQFAGELDRSSHRRPVATRTRKDIDPYMANLAAWPLAIAAGIGDVDNKKKQWLRSQLAQVGRTLGFGVFACAESDQWLEL